jgi:hypothetical protein
MVYTCFEMIRDCRADLPVGWRYFAVNYVPLIRRLLTHYAEDSDALLERVVLSLRRPDATLFQSLDPSPERWFVAQLRQAVLAQLPMPNPAITIDLATVADALSPLTNIERQAAWFETMRYDHKITGAMMKISPETVEKVRGRSAELIRGKVDSWTRTLLAENGLALGREAAALEVTKDCLESRAFLDVLDGKTTWRNKELLAEQSNRCWHCLDHLARMVEVVGMLRTRQPLEDADAARYRKLVGVQAEKRPVWKRLLGA